LSDWRCLVLSTEGQTDWRVVTADDRQGAIARLIADGLTPLEVRNGAVALLERLNRPVNWGRRLRLSEQSLLLTQLALLTRAGLPVDRSLDLLREQSVRSIQRELLAQAVARIRGGGSLASALEAIGSFPGYVPGVVRAAETGGRLGDALKSLAARLETAASTRRQLVTALTYPAAVLVATMIALVLVLTTVVPQFEPIFAGEEAKLPALTQGVLALSRLANGHAAMFLAGLVAPPVLIWFTLRSAAGRALLERHRNYVPGLRLRDQYLAAQFTGILGTLLGNGVSVVAALPLVRGAIGSARWRHHLTVVEREVREGTKLSTALARGDLVPSTAVRLLEVGERSGKLADTCVQASTIIAEAARARIDRIVALVNPIAIVALGGLVGMLVAGVMLGIFALGDFAG